MTKIQKQINNRMMIKRKAKDEEYTESFDIEVGPIWNNDHAKEVA